MLVLGTLFQLRDTQNWKNNVYKYNNFVVISI